MTETTLEGSIVSKQAAGIVTPVKDVEPEPENPFSMVIQAIQNTAQSLQKNHPADAQLLTTASERIGQQIVGWITKGQDIILQSESATRTIPSKDLAERITGHHTDRMAATVFRWSEETRYGHGVPNQMLSYDAQNALLKSLSPTVPRPDPLPAHLLVDLLDEWDWSEESFNKSGGRRERVAPNTIKCTLRTSIPGVTYEVYEVTIPSGGIKSLDHNIVFAPDAAIQTIRSIKPNQLAQLQNPTSPNP